jgi:hypothetical protein
MNVRPIGLVDSYYIHVEMLSSDGESEGSFKDPHS